MRTFKGLLFFLSAVHYTLYALHYVYIKMPFLFREYINCIEFVVHKALTQVKGFDYYYSLVDALNAL